MKMSKKTVSMTSAAGTRAASPASCRTQISTEPLGCEKEGKSPEEKELPYPRYIPGRIRRLRIERGMTQAQAAAYLRVRQQTYSEYELGRSAMHIEEFVALSRLFNVSVDYLTGTSNLRGTFPKA